MTGLVRIAGRGTLPGGPTVTWTIAEGRRGRRWREVVSTGEAIVHSLLYETDTDGRFSHLELSAGGALVTLHPEGDGTLHGNRVDADGVTHIVGLPFAVDDVVVIEGSPIAAAAIAASDVTASGGSPTPRRAVIVDRSGNVRPLAEGETPEVMSIGIDERGAPVLAEGAVWPLELDDD